MHELLMMLTAGLRMKIILIDDEPYLDRYYVGKNEKGQQLWLHRILRGDPERWLHTHPFTARSEILHGWYKEQRKSNVPFDQLQFQAIREKTFNVGATNYINIDTLHRIVEAAPNTWSLLTVNPPRMPTWKFISDEGEKIMRASSEDWHLEHGTRDYEYSKLALQIGVVIPKVDIGIKIPNFYPGEVISYIGFPSCTNSFTAECARQEKLKAEFPEKWGIFCKVAESSPLSIHELADKHRMATNYLNPSLIFCSQNSCFSGSHTFQTFNLKDEKEKTVCIHCFMDKEFLENYNKPPQVIKPNLCKSTLGVLSSKVMNFGGSLNAQGVPAVKTKRVKFKDIQIGQQFRTTTGKLYEKVGFRHYISVKGNRQNMYVATPDKQNYYYEVVE